MDSKGRKTRPPAKLQDCLTGIDIDNAFDITETEVPITHKQIDGPINNISFKTIFVKEWESGILRFFENECKTEVVKSSQKLTVIKVTVNDKSDNSYSVKFNLHSTGSIVLQGAKCKVFETQFFTPLKEFIDNNCKQNNQSTPESDQSHDDEETPVKSFFDDSETTITPHNETHNLQHTSTPVPNRTTRQTTTPKERVAMHSESIQSKLAIMNTVMETLDKTLINVTKLISEVKSSVEVINLEFTEKNSKLSKAIKETKDSIKNYESKINHANSQIDSLHTKLNILDGKINSLNETQKSMEIKIQNQNKHIENIQQALIELNEKISREETKPKEIHESSSNIKSDLESNVKQANCDYLFLCDSILKRIRTQQFSEGEFTLLRYIKGGAETCAEFITAKGRLFDPKHVIIHIGSRDLQNKGVNLKDFCNLFKVATETWPNAHINVLPLMRRKDINFNKIRNANSTIANAASRFTNISVMECFHPTDDMFYDVVHMNNHTGLPALTEHVRKCVNATSGSGLKLNGHSQMNRRKNSIPPMMPPHPMMGPPQPTLGPHGPPYILPHPSMGPSYPPNRPPMGPSHPPIRPPMGPSYPSNHPPMGLSYPTNRPPHLLNRPPMEPPNSPHRPPMGPAYQPHRPPMGQPLMPPSHPPYMSQPTPYPNQPVNYYNPWTWSEWNPYNNPQTYHNKRHY